MNVTLTRSTQGQLTQLTPSAEESLARVASAMESLVAVQRETMAAVSGLMEIAGDALDYHAQAERIRLLEWVGRHPKNSVGALLAQLDKHAPEGLPPSPPPPLPITIAVKPFKTPPRPISPQGKTP